MKESDETRPNDARDDTVICSEKVLAFHKLFYLDFKENQRGRFLKLTEKDGRFRSTVIIPEEALTDISSFFTRIVETYPPREHVIPPDADDK